MAHAVSASSYRSDRMSPTALAMAILLHALVAAALWWMSQQRDPVPPVEEAIEVSFEQPKAPQPPAPELPKPPPPPPPPPPQAQTPPPPPVDFGVGPPAAITADKATQAPPADQVTKEPPAPPPPLENKASKDPLQLEATAPPPPAPPAPPAPPVEASVQPPAPAPAPAPTPAPTPVETKPLETPPIEQGLKAAPTPPPPPTSQAKPVPQPLPQPLQQAKPAEPTPTEKPMPQQQAAIAPPQVKPPAPKPELRPSPLSTAPSKQPPSASSKEPPSPHPFVNPADAYSRAKVSDNYLSLVVRKLSAYQYQSSTEKRQGTTIVTFVIARDGRLIDASVVRSSGVTDFDNGVLYVLRTASPYAPLPPEMKGDRASFTVALTSFKNR